MQTKNINRLIKTAQGQLEGILKMIEQERECTEISAQLLATQSILKKVNVEILKSHLNHCLKESFESSNEKEKQEKIDEMAKLLDKILN